MLIYKTFLYTNTPDKDLRILCIHHCGIIVDLHVTNAGQDMVTLGLLQINKDSSTCSIRNMYVKNWQIYTKYSHKVIKFPHTCSHEMVTYNISSTKKIILPSLFKDELSNLYFNNRKKFDAI